MKATVITPPAAAASTTPMAPAEGFLYRQAYQCRRVSLSPLDDELAIRLGETIVHLTNKTQKAPVFAGAVEIDNENRLNTKSMKPVNLEFSGSTYLNLNYLAPTADKAKTEGRSKFEVVLPLLELALGDGVVQNQIFELTIDLKTRDTLWTTDSFLNPQLFPIQQIKDADLEHITVLWDQLLGLPQEARNRIELALRWYHRGLAEKFPNDKFLLFWISLEILAMTDTTDIERAAEYIRTKLFPQLSTTEIKERLQLGPLFGCRSDIVHKGLAAMEHWDDRRIQLVRNLVRELLRADVGLPYAGGLAAYFPAQL